MPISFLYNGNPYLKTIMIFIGRVYNSYFYTPKLDKNEPFLLGNKKLPLQY